MFGGRPPPTLRNKTNEVSIDVANRRDEPFINPQNEGHGPPRNPGDNIRPPHQKTPHKLGKIFSLRSHRRSCSLKSVTGGSFLPLFGTFRLPLT